MATTAEQREDEIDRLGVEELRERLKAAEEVCVIYGWCEYRGRENNSERDRAASRAWTRWADLVGTDATGPQTNRRLAKEVP